MKNRMMTINEAVKRADKKLRAKLRAEGFTREGVDLGAAVAWRNFFEKWRRGRARSEIARVTP